MAQKDKESMLGYDPLAWMNQDNDSVVAIPQSGEAAPSAGIDARAEFVQQEYRDVQTPIDDPSKIGLRTTQNLQNIAELHGKLINALENASGTISIDASAVQTIDTATLQLFVALTQEAKRLQREVLFDFPSERFIEAADLLGISSILGLDKIAAGLF